MDCCTFTQWVYRQVGIDIPIPSVEQYMVGQPIPVGDVQAGDLIFKPGAMHNFTAPDGREIGHVGIVTGEGTVVHAVMSGVRETPLAGFGRSCPRSVSACRIVG